MTIHQGIRRDMTDVSNDYGQAHYAQNVRFRILGEAGRRPGIGKSTMAKLDGPVVLIAGGIFNEPYIVQIQDNGTVTTTRNPTIIWGDPRIPPPVFGPAYLVTATLTWAGNADLDLYGENTTLGGGAVYYSNMTTDGLALNVDAHPVCAAGPDGPEIITGTFTAYNNFAFWYDQYSSCSAETAPSSTVITVRNVGAINVRANGNLLLPGQVHTTNTMAYAGYDTGGSSAFGAGTIISVTAA